MSDPLVSVVIPAFNAEPFLAEAIESVLAQTYAPYELVVVDDGSTDRSAEIAAGYDGIQLVRQENRGLPAARNAGVAASSGELLAFNDADDMMLPKRLQTQVDHLLENPGTGCVLASQEVIVEPGAKLPFWVAGAENPLFRDLGEEAITDTPDIYTVTMMFSRELFDSIGGFDESMRNAGEDVDLLFRLIEAGVAIDRLKDVVVRRRIHNESMTQDREAVMDSMFGLLKRRIDRGRERA